MSIDLAKVEEKFKSNNGFWVTYPNDEEIKIKVRPLFPEKANEFTKKSTIINASNGIKEIDQKKLATLTNHYLIEDWKGIFINGSEECTEEAKDLLMKYCEDIIKFIINQSKEIANSIVAQNDEQLKN